MWKQLGRVVQHALAQRSGSFRRLARRVAHVDEMRALLLDLRDRGLVPRSVLDVGANYGHWSRLAIEAFPAAGYLLIEPQDEMKPYLDAFCREHKAARWLRAGAGAAPGELTLTIWDDLAGSSFLPAESEQLREEGRQRRVPIVTIDSLVAEGFLDVPDLVKLDIQGFEIEALRGAGQLFGSAEVFIVETSLFRFLPGQPLLHEVVAFMAERDYLVYDIAGLLRRPYDGALGQIDVCFARGTGILRGCQRWS
jgi:FkbM family methyltransferase